MRRRNAIWLLSVSGAIFIVTLVLVLAGATGSLDSRAFRTAADLRSTTGDDVIRAFTHMGLLAFVGPVLVLAAALLYRVGRRRAAAFLLLGCALEWAAAWIVKHLVDRTRPANPLVHTTGASFPSAHAANSVGWLALSLVIAGLVDNRAGRVAIVAAGAGLTIFVGLSRVYLRAHYLSDVIGGWSLSVSMYAVAVILLETRRVRAWGPFGRS